MSDPFDLAARATRMPNSGIREVFDAAQRYDDLRDMSIGEPDFATPAPIAEAVRDAVGEGAGSYTQTPGRADLRGAISEKLAAKNGIEADPDAEVLVTPGAMGALYAATQVLCEPGDEVLVPSPYWPNYAGHLAATGADLVAVPTAKSEGFVPHPDAIERAAGENTVGMVLNTPANPTGAVVSPDRLAAIGDTLAGLDAWAILDETYEDLVYDGAVHRSLAADPERFERCVTVHSFSKSYAMTGWRVGYASGPEAVIDAMRVLQEHTVSCVSHPSQVAAKAALDNPGVVEGIREAFADRRELVLDRLEDVPGVEPGAPRGAFYVFADVSSVTRNTRELSESLMAEAGVATVPGAVFGPGGEGFLRFSYATDEGTISAAMDRFERAMRER